MKYVCKQIISKIILDTMVPEIESVRSILKSLKENRVKCSIQLSDSPKYHLSIITDVQENDFSFLIVKGQGNLLKKSKFDDLLLLEIIGTEFPDPDLTHITADISRWSMLDLTQ